MGEEIHGIILFDGVCNFCNDSVNRIIKADKKKYFRFAPLQSDLGRQLLSKYGLDPDAFDSVIFIDHNKAYVYSSSVLNIARKLGGIYSLTYIFILVPPFIRNPIYKWIGRNRYKWFGKKDACMVPDADMRSRFLA